jgi:hypothetical protein
VTSPTPTPTSTVVSRRPSSRVSKARLLITARRNLVYSLSLQRGLSDHETLERVNVWAAENGSPNVTAEIVSADRRALIESVSVDADEIKREIVASLRAQRALCYSELEATSPNSMLRGTLIQAMTKTDDLLSKVVGALAAQKVEVNTGSAAQELSRLRGAVQMVILSCFGESRADEVNGWIERLVAGEAVEELSRMRLIEATPRLDGAPGLKGK